MKILVACEESQAVTIELRRLGHEAYSCDIEPCSGGHPEWHLQVDALELLKMKWDMILAFPPCTHLAVSGARYFEQTYRSVLVKSSKIAKRKAETSESELMEFIMLDIWKPKALKTMLQIAEEKEYPIATAYILDKLPKKRGNKLNL